MLFIVNQFLILHAYFGMFVNQVNAGVGTIKAISTTSGKKLTLPAYIYNDYTMTVTGTDTVTMTTSADTVIICTFTISDFAYTSKSKSTLSSYCVDFGFCISLIKRCRINQL